LRLVSVDIAKAMEKLAKIKSLFRDEKDFRVSLGKVLTQLYPESTELLYDDSSFYPGAERVDIRATHEGMSLGIELKYKWVAMGNTEPFAYNGTEFWPPKYGQPDDVTRFLVFPEKELFPYRRTVIRYQSNEVWNINHLSSSPHV
jgi:hypothetical protein